MAKNIKNRKTIKKNEVTELKEVQLEITNQDNINDITKSIALAERQEAVFITTGKIFVEIHMGNVYNYFSSGLICPSKFITNRAFPDIQTIGEDALILTNAPSNASSDEMIQLEVLLTESDIQSLFVVRNYAYLYRPIPITRIKTIYVKSEEIKQTILRDSLIFDGGFIPERLISFQYPVEKQEIKPIRLQESTKENFSKLVTKFDQTLGLFAFIRNFSLLTSTTTNSYKSLPNHFFYAIQAIDSGFGNEIVSKSNLSEFYDYLLNDRCPPDKQLLKWLFKRIEQPENFSDIDTQRFFSLFLQSPGNKEYSRLLEGLTISLKRNVERKQALEIIDGIPNIKAMLPLYIFAFLRNYGSLNSIEIARRDAPIVYSANYGEYAFALLGYFYGYGKLRNTDERLTNSNPFREILPAISSKPAIKFQLTTEFDYRIIDLVYNHSFKLPPNQLNDQYKHLDIDPMPQVRGDHKYNVTQSTIFGKLYQELFPRAAEVPKNSEIDILSSIMKLPETIPLLSEFGLYCLRLGMPAQYKSNKMGNHLMNTNLDNLSNTTFSKNDLILHVRTNITSIDKDELNLTISLAHKHNEL